MAKPTPLEPESEPAVHPQQTSQKDGTKLTCQNLAWAFGQPTSLDIQANTREDDADSDSTQSSFGDEDDEANKQQYVSIVTMHALLHRPAYLFALLDSGSNVSLLSYAKAGIIVPDDVRNNFANLGTRAVDIGLCEVTVYGPIKLKFSKRNANSRRRYNSRFYIIPPSCKELNCDALFKIGLVRRLGLGEILGDLDFVGCRRGAEKERAPSPERVSAAAVP